MAESSLDKQAYEKKIVQRFGGQQELELVPPPPPAPPPRAAALPNPFEEPQPKNDEAAN